MKQLAVFFPGIGYHCDKPLLYYSRALAVHAGYETVSLGYAFQGGNIRGKPEKMREAGLALYAQAEDALKEIRWGEYDSILFVSKSVGTAIAAAYANRHSVNCRNVFYTPVELTFREEPRNGIAFTGTGDPWVETGIVAKGCADAGLPLTILEGGNHSLETADPMRNLDILRQVMEVTGAYIDCAGPCGKSCGQ